MASDNETVAEIVREMRAYAKNSKVNGGEVDVWNWLADYAKRIEAAHKRALAAKDDARLTIVANYETVIAAKDAEIAEIRHWIKSAARWIKCHDIYHTSGDDLIKQAKEILNDDGEFLFKKGEQ